MLKKRIHVNGAKVLVLGITFKENCPDVRNTKVVDLVVEFKDYGCNVDIYDPWADGEEVEREYGLAVSSQISEISDQKYDAVVLAVAHGQFKEMGVERIRELMEEGGVLYDIKYVLPKDSVDGRL